MNYITSLLCDGHRRYRAQRRVGLVIWRIGRSEGCSATTDEEALITVVQAQVTVVSESADAATGVEDERGLVAVGNLPAADAVDSHRAQGRRDGIICTAAVERARDVGRSNHQHLGMVFGVVNRQNVAAQVGIADGGEGSAIVDGRTVDHGAAAALVEGKADGALAEPRRAGNRSREVDAHGIGVGAGDVDLVAGFKLVARAVGVGIGRAANGDVHGDARRLGARRQEEYRPRAVLPRAAVLLLGEGDGGAGGSGGKTTAHSQRLPERGDGHADRRRRRGNLADGDTLDEHRLALQAERHGVRPAVRERRRRRGRHQVGQCPTLLQRNHRTRRRFVFRGERKVGAARSAHGIDAVGALGERDVQRLSGVADGLHGQALRAGAARALALEDVDLHGIGDSGVVRAARRHLKQRVGCCASTCAHCILGHVLAARRQYRGCHCKHQYLLHSINSFNSWLLN